MTSELILLVDDEPSIIQLARMYLERENFRVESADDGEAALESVIHLDPALILEGDWSATSGYHAVQQLLLESIPFTAVFAQNDRMAVGAIRALREAGKRIPEDISVIGFDDMPLASYFDPPLTTMGQDMFKMGSEAVKLLMRAIEQPESPRQHLRLPAALITRRSTSRIN